MNRNLEEVRRKNLLGKGEILGKPPSAVKKTPVTKVFILFYLSFLLFNFILFSHLEIFKSMSDFVQPMINKLL